MSYFNHAFRKSFVGTKATQPADANKKAVDNGFLMTPGVHSRYLSSVASPYTLGVGTFGFFDPTSYLSVVVGAANVIAGAPLVLAASALMPNDQIGPFHGGYNESNKSKLINPRLINKFYKMTAAEPEQSILHVGNTNLNKPTAVITVAGAVLTNGTYTAIATTSGGAGIGLTVKVTVLGGVVTSAKVNKTGTGYITGDVVTTVAIPSAGAGTIQAQLTLTVLPRCSFEFMCAETYNLGITLKGSPVLRLLNHEAYRTLAAYTGCCSGAAPVNVDSTLVMIDWAKQIKADVYLKDFINPVVYTEEGNALFATDTEALAAGYLATDIWTTYVSPGHVAGKVAGLRLIGAYVSTEFGNCSFEKTDFFEKEVVQIKASLTDLTGDVCSFTGLCVNQEAAGFSGQGYGETILRDIILDESYLQNVFHSDQRLREINQGTSMLSAIPRNAKYTRYVIQHVVPRYYNNSSVNDNDQYALNIYVPAVTATAFEAFMVVWLGGADQGISLETFGHTIYTPKSI